MVDLFLDSGAFSAFTQGVEIDIDEYIAFIKKHEEQINVYANLDAIGDPDQTWKNQRYMEKKGLRPLPCFHYGEPVEYLTRYLKRYKYLALGGMVPISTPDLSVWLDDLFANHLCDSEGMPKVKVHGFGMTAFKLLFRYPWYSVDSTSWVLLSRMGGVPIPVRRNGTWDYMQPPHKIQVSNKSPSRKEAGKHISTINRTEREIFQQYLSMLGYVLGSSSFRDESADYELLENERWNGKAVGDTRSVELIKEEGVCNSYILRDEVAILYYRELEKQFTPWPWAYSSRGVGGFSL